MIAFARGGESLDPQTVLRPRAIRLEGLGLSPTDAFVLSQLDGVLALEEVAEITAVPLSSVLSIAERLAALGAVEAPPRVGTPKRVSPNGRYATQVAPRTAISKKAAPASRAGPVSSRTKPPKPKPSTPKLTAVRADTAPTVRPSARAGRPGTAPAPAPAVCELDEATRARIDAELVEGRNHYGVLGIARSASLKEVQAAYQAIAAVLHPDRMIGKQLGDYEPKLQRVFDRVALAYATLRDDERRAEYDAYLKLTRQSMRMEAVLAAPSPESGAPTRPPPSKRRSVEPAAQVRRSSEPPSVKLPAAPPRTREPVSVEPPASPSGAPPVTVEPIAASVEPPAPAAMSVETVAPSKRLTPEQQKAADVLAAAQKALATGDAVAAANHYRLALHYAEDAAARGYAESGLREARNMLVDMHLKKARYEEKEARWSDAVVSYDKALEGRPEDPAISERLANALRREGTDLVRAVKLAEFAVQRVPRRGAYRATLGLIYAESGAREKAIEQLERAREMDSLDEDGQRLLDSLKKRRR